MVFVKLYDFFRARRPLFWALLLGVVTVLGVAASQVTIEEDISRIFPDDRRVKDLRDVFQRSRFVERVVVMVSQTDSTQLQTDSLVVVARRLETILGDQLREYVADVSGRVGEDQLFTLYQLIREHLPVFLDDADFEKLDSLNREENVPHVLEANYRQLVSPSGFALKPVIVNDPLGYTFLVLRRLQQLQFDPGFDLYDDYVVTKDQRTLLLFVQPAFDPQDTHHNRIFLEQFDQEIAKLAQLHPEVRVSYFGGASVAAGNAEQLRKDSFLTIGIMVVLVVILLVGYFRRKRAPFLVLIPVLFGGLFALASIYFLRGSVSVLALAAGSVILGIAVNYALHFLVHLSHVSDVRVVVRELTGPLTLGGFTTVLAFLCLQFANASVLRDIGLFAALSLIGAALCTLVILPHFVSPASVRPVPAGKRTIAIAPGVRKVALSLVVVLTLIFLWHAGDVRFNTDMSRLNFMDERTQAAQAQLERINRGSIGNVYVVSRGHNFETALRKAERAQLALDSLQHRQLVTRFTTPALLLVSDSLQKVRLERWVEYWDDARRARMNEAVRRAGADLKFAPKVMQNFDTLITRQYQTADAAALAPVRKAFFENFIIEEADGAVVIAIAQTPVAGKQQVIGTLQQSSIGAVDRQMLANMIVEYVHADFDLIVGITAIIVFVALLLAFGRVEIALITFAPMFITWIWILGVMALLGIEFNIVNVMVSTFIFGLGDDYSIFVMDGLLQRYRTGKENMGSIRTSIFLSALATIAGLGVLIFAQHPALRSIASISIIGIVCVLIMSQLIEPYLFHALITKRTAKGRTPMTWVGMLRTTVTYSFFVLGSFAVTLIGLVLKLIPFGRATCRYLLHATLRCCTWILIYQVPSLRKRIYGRTAHTFSRPGVIIANHSSFLDILLTTMLHPRLILLTNQWVWRSPVFGGVVRLADYYPVAEGAEESVARFADRVAEGYSIVVFPEGKRSEDDTIHRFHKGAFFLAEQLRLPVKPLLIHGAAWGIAKGTFYLNEAFLSLKFLPPIEHNDPSFGVGYAARTKSINRYFREAFAGFAKEEQTPAYFRYKLISNYLYKGPVLEWYTRIKTKMEDNYAVFDRLLPRTGRIVDLGCGYGYLCYMMQFTGAERTITGVDYDEDKIETARHGYTRTDQLQFVHADITQYPLEASSADGIVINDVLHYLPQAEQDALIRKCIGALTATGVLVIRDGNADLGERHHGTRITEFFSVKLLGFNKATHKLNFISGAHIREVASDMDIEVIDHAKFTSNVIFVLRRKNVERKEI